jgi:hypothetical protein
MSKLQAKLKLGENEKGRCRNITPPIAFTTADGQYFEQAKERLADAVEEPGRPFERINEKAIVEYVTQVGNNPVAHSQPLLTITARWEHD